MATPKVRSTTRRAARVALSVGAVVVLVMTSSCGLMNGAARGAKSVVGVFPGPYGREVWLIDPGVLPPTAMVDSLAPEVDRATAAGASVEAFVVTSGSAASLSEVTFSKAAGHGDFAPSGGNSAAWSTSARAFAVATKVDLRRALAAVTVDAGSGDDVVGAVRRATTVAVRMPGRGPASVIVHTGGGVERTATLNLADAGTNPATIAALAVGQPRLGSSSVHVTVSGVGNFDGVTPPVDPGFADGVTDFWNHICQAPACQFGN